ncbi:hypothetical protein BJF93_13065 [Xaviernesmea oryzae]|uniref:Uncharacterized protein n=1 Tax=Xaviernesmea oryzae TaxID=464029 RepID=A0A1Q9AQX2_9HYPH|nr:hypothetical protein [Xaviernesmea oryzae]OLP57781.1 hypothetical protein BJF93_13065 [Xaviernesmea oryzae]
MDCPSRELAKGLAEGDRDCTASRIEICVLQRDMRFPDVRRKDVAGLRSRSLMGAFSDQMNDSLISIKTLDKEEHGGLCRFRGMFFQIPGI